MGHVDIFKFENERSCREVVLYKCSTSRELVIYEFIEKLRIEKVSIHEGSGLRLKSKNGLFPSKTKLKSLVIDNTEKIEYLFCLSSSPSIFQSVESVELRYLDQLQDLFGRERDGVPSPTTIRDAATFSNLKTFEISKCAAMKKLFSPG